MTDCIQAGVGGAVVISGGFGESGRNDLQDRIVSIATKVGFPFVGDYGDLFPMSCFFPQ
jgi:acetyltransferase